MIEVYFYNWRGRGEVDTILAELGYEHKGKVSVDTLEGLGEVIVNITKKGLNTMLWHPTQYNATYTLFVDNGRFKQG